MKADKENILEVTITSVNQRMHYTGSVDGQDTINIDYTPPFGDNLGYTSLELLLLSLASCITATVTTMLRSRGTVISSASCTAKGIRRQQLPQGFSSIDLNIVLESGNLKNEDVETTIQIARESIAPVWSMLREDVTVNVNYQIINDKESHDSA